MYNVSEIYKTQIKQTLRNPSYIKVEFSIVDPQAIGDASLSDNVAETHYSDLSRTTGIYDVAKTYMTLEHNRFFLDGQNPLAPELDATEMLYQGFVGATISGDDRTWSDSPKITINFLTTYFEFIGLTFSFDTVRNEFPEQFRIVAYKDALEVYNVLVTPDRADMYVHEDNIPECNKIEIIPTKSTTPHRRFRFQNIIFGVIKIFDNDVVSTSKLTQELDLINSKLPKNNFDFTIIDVNREYDPENPLGIYQYMESQQPINFKYGYELNDGSIEWIQGGNTFTTGEIDVKSEAVIPMVSFKTTSTLAYLIDVYKEGIYTGSPVSLYDLAMEVLEFANIPLNAQGQVRWKLDDALKSIYTTSPLPVGEVRVLLQLIANAGMCVLYVDRDGNIVIEPKDITPTGFTFELSDVYTIPSTSKYPILNGVDTYASTLTVRATAEELGSFDIVGASDTLYEFDYSSMATDVVATAGSGLTIVGTPTYYANMCRVVLTGTGKLTINGKIIDVGKNVVSVEFNSTGDRCPIENSLITSRSHAVAYATWIGNYVNRRNEYEFEDRGFPELDCGDELALNTLFNDGVNGTLISAEISFNGTLKGKSKILKQ